MSDTDTPPAPPVPPRKRRGCFFYGCVVLGIFALLFCLLAIITGIWMRNYFYSFTDPAPVTLPRVELPDAEYQALQQRINAFGDAINQDKPAEPLTLTEREIDGLIAKNPDLANKAYITLNDDRVQGQVSIPLPSNFAIARGRYLNGNATLNVSLQNGALIVTVQDIEVKGRPIPQFVLAAIRSQNFAQNVYQNPKAAETLSKLDSIQIHDGEVTIKPRATQ